MDEKDVMTDHKASWASHVDKYLKLFSHYGSRRRLISRMEVGLGEMEVDGKASGAFLCVYSTRLA